MNRFLIIFALLVLTGCTTPYVPPQFLIDCNDATHTRSPDVIIAGCSNALGTNGLDSKNVAGALINRGTAYLRNADYPQAIADFNASIAITPQFAAVFVDRAGAYNLLGDNDSALKDYNTALLTDPSDRPALGGRAQLYSELGKPGLAQADLQTLLALGPDNPVALSTKCYVSARTNGDAQAALNDCRQALAKGSRTAQSIYGNSLALYRTAQYQSALLEIEFMLHGKITWPSALYLRGLIKQHLGDSAGAKADMDRAVALRPPVKDEYSRMGITS